MLSWSGHQETFIKRAVGVDSHNVPGPNGTTVPAVDFISTMDTPYPYELNIWYHTLNCGYRTRISGETDFPCIYGERVGLGRSYVRQAKLDYRRRTPARLPARKCCPRESSARP